MNHPLDHASVFQGRQGFEAWHGDLSSNCGTFHVEPPADAGIASFRGAVTAVTPDLSSLQGARITSNCRHVHRSRRDIRQDDKDFFYLVMQVGGEALMCQSDSQTRLGSGDLVLLDITQPCDFYFEGLSDQFSVILPRNQVLQRFREGQILLNRRIGSASPLGAMGGMLVGQLFSTPLLRIDEATAMREAILALLRPALDHGGLGAQADGPLLLKAKTFIERHLADEALCPEQIAGSIGTSLRNLHRLFAQMETTVGRYILDRRLQSCATAIRESEQKISSIAFARGFKDFSHFSRSFKNHFGVSPRGYRTSK
ncbi:transcriptional regulator FeaR [Pseudomonas citronellolis]|uniref:Transcriptional regulator FeaR n=1 Tax=Pseudomonas citronellolis TaxID=53408 RepID=A0AAW6P3Q7_9PSED|nr:transcriptional regulator FeaR [Pseudomonas citronellolis]AMO77193.1 Transcriptional activator FeaR [Pseudomonas citronellolis]KRV72636.1 hypothetical protein AO742_18550 [Pseudomonas citronellolis]KRW77726.1 hypothetical protein AO738_04130 [Pseudomonas citronellolis]MBH3433215.1 transcriptional regulator FeaR [Pseudomonas citronellolis]MDF3840986.1 transcriptional regulator FeaR [Pseudomonas citronellolis]